MAEEEEVYGEDAALEEEEFAEEVAEEEVFDEEAQEEVPLEEGEEFVEEEAPIEDEGAAMEEEATFEEGAGEPLQLEWKTDTGAPIEPYGQKFVVKLRRKMGTQEHCQEFCQQLTAVIEDCKEQGKTCIFEDFDISQNVIPSELLQDIITSIMDSSVHVERLRIFGVPTCNDEVAAVVGAWLGMVTAENAPLECHLSDNAVTADGFDSIMQGIIENEALPAIDPRFPDRGSCPLYLRVEFNYINPESIQRVVDEGIACIAKKSDRIRMSDKLKVRLITNGGSCCEQYEGEPPPPEEAPKFKHVKDFIPGKGAGSNRKDGKGKGKDSRKGDSRKGGGKNGKDSRDRGWGSGYDRDRDSKGKGKGKSAKDRRPLTPPRKPSSKDSGKGGGARVGDDRRPPWAALPERPSSSSSKGGRDGKGYSKANGNSPYTPAPVSRRAEANGWNSDSGASERAPFNAFGSRGKPAENGKASSKGSKGARRAAEEDARQQDAKRPRYEERKETRPAETRQVRGSLPSTGGGASAGKSGGKGSEERLPPNWERHYSKEHSLFYYWNSKTGESAWQKPTR